MKRTDRLEADVLSLPARDRERLALIVWESLAGDDAWLSDPSTDPEGVVIARARDEEIESGQVEPLSQEEFLKRTRGASE